MSNDTIQFYDAEKPWGELSNFYQVETPLIFDGKEYRTSEHLYQALKFFTDEPHMKEYVEEIRKIKTPNMSKILARQKTSLQYGWQKKLHTIIQEYLSKDVKPIPHWESIKVDAMRIVLLLKFSTDAHCRKVLLSTENKKLVEDSPRDYFWGSGKDGSGKNVLGELLMETRNKLRLSENLSDDVSATVYQQWKDTVLEVEETKHVPKKIKK